MHKSSTRRALCGRACCRHNHHVQSMARLKPVLHDASMVRLKPVLHHSLVPHTLLPGCLQGAEHEEAASACCTWVAELMRQHLATAHGPDTIRMHLPDATSQVGLPDALTSLRRIDAYACSAALLLAAWQHGSCSLPLGAASDRLC